MARIDAAGSQQGAVSPLVAPLIRPPRPAPPSAISRRSARKTRQNATRCWAADERSRQPPWDNRNILKTHSCLDTQATRRVGKGPFSQKKRPPDLRRMTFMRDLEWKQIWCVFFCRNKFHGDHLNRKWFISWHFSFGTNSSPASRLSHCYTL